MLAPLFSFGPDGLPLPRPRLAGAGGWLPLSDRAISLSFMAGISRSEKPTIKHQTSHLASSAGTKRTNGQIDLSPAVGKRLPFRSWPPNTKESRMAKIIPVTGASRIDSE